MGKAAVMSTLKPYVTEAAGDLHLCAGQNSGCEAAIHSMRTIYEEDTTDAILLVDASNAFNSLNRKVMLHNIRLICPLLATYVINSYNMPARLFIYGGKEIQSCEGTTQGDPISMAVYALGLLPLLWAIATNGTRHVAFADDLTGAGSIETLHIWWNKVCEHGPSIGYNPKAEKSWLIVKPEKMKLAKATFANSNINITVEGKRHLGAAIGKTEFKAKYIRDIVEDWCMQLRVLSKIALIYPHAAYCAFTSGFRQKFNYSRTRI